jgi:hypothetical protein
MVLTFGTAFVSPELSSLRELEPYYFDPDMLPRMDDSQMLSTFDTEEHLIDLSDYVMERNELSEPTEEELEESLRALREYNLRYMTEFIKLLNSGLSFSELTEDNRTFLLRQLGISNAAVDITRQLFRVMESDGFTLAESVELVMIMAGGLFDYIEAQSLLNSTATTRERLTDIFRFEHFAQRFDIADEVNSRRLVNREFVSINGFTETGTLRIGDISVFLNANRAEVQYSFVDAVQTYELEVSVEAIAEFEEQRSARMRQTSEREEAFSDEGFSDFTEYEFQDYTTDIWSPLDELTQEEYITTRATFSAFTNQRAFSEALRMFLSNYSSVEIETAFALGAALRVEPEMLILRSETRSTTSQVSSNGSTSVDDIATVLFADVIRENQERGELDPQVIEPEIPPNQPEFEAMLSAIDADTDEVDGTLNLGMTIMNFGAAGVAPLSINHDDIISSPFTLNFNADESVCLNTGAVMYRVNILSLPGRGGFGFNLDMVHNTGDADLRRPGTNVPNAAGRHGLGIGWKFDLPHILNNVLYVPGRGSFVLNGNTIVDYTLHDMRLFNDTSFTSANRTSTRRLTFLNGTSYFFNGNLLIGMRDRNNNTIRYEYTTVSGWGANPLLLRIIDTNGRYIDFSYAISGNNRTVTITDPGGGTFTIYMSRIIDSNSDGIIANPGTHPFRIDSVRNQVGAVTTFDYWVGRIFYDFHSKGPWHRNYAVLLRRIIYPAGAFLDFSFSFRTTNMGHNGSRHSYIVTTRWLNGEQKATFTYQGDPTAFPQPVDRPPAHHTYRTTVTQNNGLRTVYTFNHLHLNTTQRTYNVNTLLSNQTITYNNDRLPTNITLTEHHSGRSRVTTQQFSYNRYGQITQSVSPIAQGSTLARYRTDFTYDNRFGLPLTTTSRPDASTTVVERNTLSADGKRITGTSVYENNYIQQ